MRRPPINVKNNPKITYLKVELEKKLDELNRIYVDRPGVPVAHPEEFIAARLIHQYKIDVETELMKQKLGIK